MLGFHTRTRSLIPVKELAKYDRLDVKVADDMDADLDYDSDVETLVEERSSGDKQLLMIYIIFLAEAIMSASLQPQLKMLLQSDDFCGNLSSSYLRSILDCAYAFGGTTGLLWGFLADRIGRRPVTLIGLFGMSSCCLCMGFATDLVTCAIFRFVSGMISSSVLVVTLTMISDLTVTYDDRIKRIARLPMIAVLGSTGPFLQSFVSKSLEAAGGVWQQFPILGGELACGILVSAIAVTATLLLKETLPRERKSLSSDLDCEKAAFLGQMLDDGLPSPTISVVDFARPEPMSVAQFIQAPSLLILLSSFSLLSLHAATFDVLLPHLGHSSSQHGGMGIPCSWLGLIVLLVRAVAAILIIFFIPRLINQLGLLQAYRTSSLWFPILYIVTPLLAFLTACSTPMVALISISAILAKHLLAGSAQVVVSILMLNATPDAFSAGTVVGLMQVACLFKALAVAVSGASFHLSSDYSIATTNYALWSCLGLFGVVGAGMAWFVRERPSVERDFPSETLKWETFYDMDS